MKVGDLVRLKEVPELSYLDHYGSGIILQVLSGGHGRKNPSARVLWAVGMKERWHAEPAIEIVNESR